ncbi:MAG: PD40 domain-containing protein [Ignavibacteriales bacterium]|nr:PD40 domain-containing protein [Ignavibacteriales bacterium]MBI3787774.1 PD40 domain-containing protein [Ignavibacteriales bacterium]
MRKNYILYVFRVLLIWLLLLALSLSCNKENPIDEFPCGGIDPLIVPEPPYNSPIWHPSGRFIGFNHSPLRNIEYPRGEQCWGVQHFDRDSMGFWLINSDGTNLRRIFPYVLQTPTWSPDGQWIAFVAGVQIFKMRFTGTTFDTTTLIQLTSIGRNFFPAWSPDGQWIAYDSNINDSKGANVIWKMFTDGNGKRDISQHGIGEWRMPNWSPDGKRIVHQRYVGVGAPEIVIMDTSGGSNIRLTFDNQFDSNPKYSPDGTEIAFWSNSNLWLMDTSGANQRQITTQGVDVSFGLPFNWSPDGTKIVYTVYRSDDWGYENGVLWMFNLNTDEKKQLTFNRKPSM